MPETIRVIGVGFNHMHIGDQLQTAVDHPRTTVVGAFDSNQQRRESVLSDLGLDVPQGDDLDELLATTRPDVAFVCTATADHAAVITTLAKAGVHAILEKPFADSLEAVDRMIAAGRTHGTLVTVNWPLAWVPSHRTAQRLITEGEIGAVQGIHFYDGNRGPLFHSHGKIELAPTTEQKASSWWYSKEAGGGSLRDYLGYGVTLGTWFRGGGLPTKVTASWFVPEGLEVDEQSVVVAHYDTGLSVFETRWGTQSDPWSLQPSPRCGFVITGKTGSITSWDYAAHVTIRRGNDVQPERVPADSIALEDSNSLANLVAHLDSGRPLDAPLTAEMSRAGHAIVEVAILSAELERQVKLSEVSDL